MLERGRKPLDEGERVVREGGREKLSDCLQVHLGG